MSNIKSKILIINKEWCKGCGICVEFCPKNVYDLVENKPEPVREKDCIKCKQCEIRCPDFAITVRSDKDE